MKSLRSTLLVIASLALTGCVSWTPATADPRDVVARGPGTVRVHRPDGTSVEIDDPVIQNDSIAGLARRRIPRRVTGVVALQDVRGIEVKRRDWVKSAGLGALIYGTGVLLAWITCGSTTACE